MKLNRILVSALVAGGMALAGGFVLLRGNAPAPVPAVAVEPAQTTDAAAMDGLRQVLAAYRKIIVLFADEKKLTAGERELANQVGQSLFHENIKRSADLEALLETIAAPGNAQRFAVIGALLDFVETDGDLFDADRLAFREILRSLHGLVARDGSLPAIKLHKRIGEDLDALAEIERTYDK